MQESLPAVDPQAVRPSLVQLTHIIYGLHAAAVLPGMGPVEQPRTEDYDVLEGLTQHRDQRFDSKGNLLLQLAAVHYSTDPTTS